MKKIPDKYTKQPLGRLFSSIGRTLLNALNVRLHNLDIERNYYALILIEEGNGKITQQELADLLESDKVSVVRIIDYLSNKGYVKRIKDSSDKRKYRLTSTNKAKKALPIIKKAIEEITQNALKELSRKKIEKLYNTLNSIKNNLN